MQSKIEFPKNRDFGEIITDSFIFIRQNLKPLLKNFFIFCGFFMLAGGAAAILQQTKVLQMVNGSDFPRVAPSSYGATSRFNIFTPEYFIVIIFSLLNFTAMNVTVYSYIALYKEKGNIAPTTEELWGYFKYFYLKILGSGILIFILILIGTILCFIPGIYLFPVMALVVPVMIFENTSFSYGFNRSFRIIKGNWWSTFGTFFVVGIIVYFAVMIVVMPAVLFNIINLALHPGKGMHLSITITVITTILQEICQVFFILLLVACSMIYFNLTEQMEGTGLLNKISHLGEKSDDSHLPTEEY